MSRLYNKIRFRFLVKPWYDYYIYLGFHYHNLFFCSLIKEGKKLKAFNFLLLLKANLKTKEVADPFYILLISFMNITPEVFLRYYRSGSVKYGVGMPISERKKITFAIKWTVKLLKDKNRSLTIDNLSDAIIGSLYNKSESFKLKNELYKLAINNRYLISKYYK